MILWNNAVLRGVVADRLKPISDRVTTASRSDGITAAKEVIAAGIQMLEKNPQRQPGDILAAVGGAMTDPKTREVIIQSDGIEGENLLAKFDLFMTHLSRGFKEGQ